LTCIDDCVIYRRLSPTRIVAVANSLWLWTCMNACFFTTFLNANDEKNASSVGPAVVASFLCPAIGCAFGVYMQSKREALYRWPKHVEKNGCLNLGQNRYIRHALQICSLPNIQPTRLTCKFVGDKSSMFPRMFNMTIRSCKVQHIRTTCGIDLHKFLLAATLQLSIFWFLMLTK
jgi:hypothetical protein